MVVSGVSSRDDSEDRCLLIVTTSWSPSQQNPEHFDHLTAAKGIASTLDILESWPRPGIVR
jgi:hypothetical protein